MPTIYKAYKVLCHNEIENLTHAEELIVDVGTVEDALYEAFSQSDCKYFTPIAYFRKNGLISVITQRKTYEIDDGTGDISEVALIEVTRKRRKKVYDI